MISVWWLWQNVKSVKRLVILCSILLWIDSVTWCKNISLTIEEQWLNYINPSWIPWLPPVIISLVINIMSEIRKITCLAIIAHVDGLPPLGDDEVWVLYIEGLMQERRNSSALAMELRLCCTNPSIYIIQTPEGLNLRCIFTCCIVKVKLSRSEVWSTALMKIRRNVRNGIRVKWRWKCGSGLRWRPPLYKHTNCLSFDH